MNKQKSYVSDSIIHLAVQKKMKVIPTIAIGITRETIRDSVAKARFVKDFIRRYTDAGGIIALGSDRFNQTLSFEIDALLKLDALSNKEVLHILTYNTPKLIFPERKIGALQDGYEASFLVLDNNPLERIESLKNINLRVKRGIVLKDFLE